MTRPGTTITRSDSRPARGAPPTAVSPWFVAGITGTADTNTQDGVNKPVTSLAEYAGRFGSRASHSDPALYDAAEFHLKEGGSAIYVKRTDDATDAVLQAALDAVPKDLGPGQVSAPGRVAATQRLIVANHAAAANRTALLGVTNTATLATVVADATIAGINDEASRVSAIFGPWQVVPGVTPGTTRTIDPVAIVAGIMARNDGEGVNPNQPSAGDLGVSYEALAPAYTYSDPDRTTLNANGVNVLRSMYGDVRVYGYRTLADPETDDNYVNLANQRLYMAIQAQAEAICQRYVFRQLDGQRKTVNEFGGALTGMLLPFWQAGALYGLTADQAFRVEVGPQINTDDSLATNTLKAKILLKMSPFAEEVQLDITKARPTEVIA